MSFKATLQTTDVLTDGVSQASDSFAEGAGVRAPLQVGDAKQAARSLPLEVSRSSMPLQPSGSAPFHLPASLVALLQQAGPVDRARPTAEPLPKVLLAALSILVYRYIQPAALQLALTVLDPQLRSTSQIRLSALLEPETTARSLIKELTLAIGATNSPLGLKPRADCPVTIEVRWVEQRDRTSDLAEAARQQSDADRSTTERADLQLTLMPQAEAIVGTLHYNSNLFRSDTMERLTGHLQVLLPAMVQHPDTAIGQLPLLTAAEVEQLTAPGPVSSYPVLPVHRQIEAHAKQQPHAIAVTFRDQQLTYAELNRRANQLAYYLNCLGVGAEVPVAVCVEPSLDIAVCLLGIFKAGGIYVPLDPSYPVERLSTMLADTQPKLVLAQAHLLGKLTAWEGSVFCVDRDWAQIATHPDRDSYHKVGLDQTAYLVYTSGTTGQPKGVMTSHRNLINYILVAQEQYGFNRQDVMPAIARFTFSITMFELLSPLVAGGRLVILEREHILDFARLTQTLAQVTVVHTSPSLMRKLIEYIQANSIDLQQFAGLRHASCGGDLVPADLLEAMKTVFVNAELFVIYGCSEVSCMGCTTPIPRTEPAVKGRVGKPFPNVAVRLYDAQQVLVPVGVIGEIYIGGAGVTKGYLNRPDLSAAKFVTIAGERFYRTGDLGRFDSAGNLEMLGRNDFQIQLRGMRIEPGEIESTLRQLSGVREAVVMARDLHPGELGLVAYVVLDPDRPPALEDIRRFLQTKLPDYMVPALVMPLAALPLTPNLKVDRRALPAPDFSSLARQQTRYTAPRSPLEALIADTWMTVLGVSPGIEDDFFALGGHSLLATQVIDRLRTALALDIPIRCLFESPTIAELATALKHLQATAAPAALPAPLVRRSQPSAEAPLSATQTGLWFLSQLDEGRALNIPLAFDLVGQLDVTALADSFSEVVRRHEPLRTIFPVVNGTPVQRVLPAPAIALPVVDLQELPDPQEAVAQLAQAAAQHRFNLATEPPIKMSLLQLGPTAHVLLLTIHHIAADGWSLGVLRRELAALYSARLEGTTAALPDLPIQYADFVSWQQQWLQGEWCPQQLAYWQRQLAGAPPLLELPTDRPRPPVQSYQGGTEFFTLDAALTQQLKQLSQQTRTTLFMTLLATFATLLSRYSGQTDLVIGSPIANRHRRELEPLIGFFINVLALRIDLADQPNFLTLLQRVRQSTLDAYAHQDVPFGQVKDAVQPDRNLSHSPLFQVMFILQNSPAEDFVLPGLTVAPHHVESGVSQYDLRLMLEETAEGLVGEFEYNRDLFEPATITRLVGHFQTLLQAVVSDPAQPIATLPLLTAPERQQLLAPEADRSDCADACIQELFEAQVAQTPSAIAVVFEQQQLTYRELNDRANQLAHYLRSQQIGTDDLVAICAERSLEMLIGFLGVLKAGAAYVPIDPDYPAERQAHMLQDAQVRVILTQAHLAAGLPTHRATLVRLDADWPTIAQHPTTNPQVTITPHNLAYVIYTSGSTGLPKGVMITHRGMVNHSRAIAEYCQLHPRDRVLQFASLSFDIAVEELFPPLVSGCTIVFRTEGCLVVKQFVQFVTEQRITVLDLPTAFWHEIVNELPQLGSFPDSVRLVIVGGEKALRSAYTTWRQFVQPEVRWLNTYGPTETTVTATVYDPAAETDGQTDIPIGRPIANTQIYILDAQLNLVPVGVPGELYIGGAGVARGYLHRPELTGEKFIPNPFGGGRLYRTGDLARYLPDGNLEFLGRIDQQVKIRGFRIELGEVETVLGQHPQVRDAIVLARPNPLGQPQLVAFVVLHPGYEPPATTDLREFLRGKLPDYMLPTTIVRLEALPLTPNGKVDRRALQSLDLTVAMTEQQRSVAPRDDLERQLVEMWQTLLGVANIGVTDNFFDLGGHSLLAVRLWSQVEQAFGRDLPLATLYQAPTIEQFAARLRQGDATPVCPSLVILQPGSVSPTRPPLFCIHVLGRGMKFYRPMLQFLDPQQPVYGLSTNISGEPLPYQRVEDLAAHYLQQMRSLQPQGPYLLIGVSFGGMVAYEIAQQLRQQGQEVGFLGLLDTYAPGAVKPRSTSQQMEEHWQYLSSMGPTYLLRKLARKGLSSIQQVGEVTWELYRRAELKFLSVTEQPLPEHLQDFMYESQSLKLAMSYRIQPYAGRATLFKALELSKNVSVEIDSALGWGDLAQGGLDIQEVPGSHLSILQPPHVQVLADKLQNCLRRSIVHP